MFEPSISQTETMTVAYLTMRGAYSQIPQGYETAGPAEEAYLTDPAEVPPEEYLTEIAFPVKTR